MSSLKNSLWIKGLLALNLLALPAWAQDNEFDDFEEGGPPMEAPYVQEDFNEFSDEPTVSPSEVIAAPRVEETESYITPRRPRTEEGRMTGTEMIPHPMAEKGLLRIEEDGSYIYKSKDFKQENIGVLIRAGQINPVPQIEGSRPEITYESMYGTTKPIQVMADFEWYPFTGFGKLGVQVGLGFFTSTGNGRFSDDLTEAREVYTFYGVPLSGGAVYRMQGSDSWLLAPYIAGGGSYYALLEKRDDDKPWSWVGVPAAYGAAGVLFNITELDRGTDFTLESEYGIHNMWLSFEYRYVKAMSQVLDVSANIISAGLVLDY